MKKENSPLDIDPTKVLLQELGKDETTALLKEIDKKIAEAFAYELPKEKERWINKLWNSLSISAE